MSDQTGRTMLATSAAAAIAQAPPIPIHDTHSHFFEVGPPQGVPYPGNGGLYGNTKAGAALFRKTAAHSGVVGAIEVEAIPLIEDNL